MNDFRAKFESAASLRPLLDISFNTFITLSILKIIYVLVVGVEVLAAIVAMIGGFRQGFMVGLGGMVLTPVVLLIAIIITRIYFELIAVIFRIAHNTTILATHAEAS